jgi:hypothetical protein
MVLSARKTFNPLFSFRCDDWRTQVRIPNFCCCGAYRKLAKNWTLPMGRKTCRVMPKKLSILNIHLQQKQEVQHFKYKTLGMD